MGQQTIMRYMHMVILKRTAQNVIDQQWMFTFTSRRVRPAKVDLLLRARFIRDLSSQLSMTRPLITMVAEGE